MSRWITFTQYHPGENQSGSLEGILREVWSTDWHQSMKEVGLSEDMIEKLYLERTGGNWYGAQFPKWEEISDDMANVVAWLVGDEEKAVQAFSDWLEKVVAEAPSVGGDDSYYDYYPDQFHVADQVGAALGREDLVEDAKNRVRALGMYDDGDADI